MGTSVLVKLHRVADWHAFLGGRDEGGMAGRVDAVFVSHRDLREVTRSIRDMGWGTYVSERELGKDDFCKRKGNERYLRPEEYGRTENWVMQARAEIKCRQVLLEAAGAALRMDLRAEDVGKMEFGEVVGTLRQMGEYLDYDFSESELRMAAVELGRLRVPPCEGGGMTLNPVTHLHRGHMKGEGIEEDEVVRLGMKAIGSDTVCRKWLISHHYVSE